MKKPGSDFEFRPSRTNTISSSEPPDFSGSPIKSRHNRSRRELERSYSELIRSSTFGPPPLRTSLSTSMARSRSASFSDDDLQFVSSQMIAEQQSQPKSFSSSHPSQRAPMQPTTGNKEVIDLMSSPAGPRGPAPSSHSATPEFGKTTMMASQPSSKMFSSLYKKEKKPPSVFLQPKKRPEQHRGHLVSGPSALKYDDRKAAPLPMFSSLPPGDEGSTKIGNGYSQTAMLDDQVFYTDPKRANDDLKALLEGGMDEDEDEEAENESKEPKPDGDREHGHLEGINVRLLPHQEEGVQWMKGRELGPVKRGKVPKGGILADDMGLGKTLQSLSLIISCPKPKKEDKGWKKHYDSISKCTLVVAPLALIRQWEAEINEKVAKSHRLSVSVHHGPGRTKRYTDLLKYDVVITTYQILVSEHGHSTPEVGAGCFGVHWFRVILDEAHTIKNRNAKATKACCELRTEFRWCLTGTPMQNNLDELQSLVKFLRIAPYDELKHWRENIDQPMKNGKGHLAIRRLHSLLRCFMKRRTKEILKEEGALNPGGKKALDTAAAAAVKNGEEAPKPAAPAFKVTERKVVAVAAQFSPAERRFYDRMEKRADESLKQMMRGKVNYANALVLLLRLRQACNHPKLVALKFDETDKDALAMDAVQQPKTADDDLDALADALGGMDIQVKQCDICLSDLSKAEVSDGISTCEECENDRKEFETESPERRRAIKKKIKKVVKEKVKVEAKKRIPRNRRAVVDSDDEEDEGSWLVPEDQQGSLRLGTAGGEEDENAEGAGEWLNSEDSVHHSEDEKADNSRLDSFIVDDEEPDHGKKKALDSDEDSLLSVSKLTSRKADNLRTALESDDSSDEEEDSDVDSAVSSHDEVDDDAWLYKKAKPHEGKTVPSAKIRQLVKILHKEAHEHKFIVFSQFTSMLNLIEPFLEREGFKFTRYDGSMKNDMREESLSRLRNDPRTRVLLCSLKCGSLGLNLTAATRVVILEPFWNPFIEEQAIDRVHRLTQTVDVVVYKLTIEKSVEERILELQNKKRLLAEQAIEGGMRKKKDAMGLGLNEMLALFTHSSSDTRDEVSGGHEFNSNVVGQDVGGTMSGFMRKKKGDGAPARVDPAFDRRWG